MKSNLVAFLCFSFILSTQCRPQTEIGVKLDEGQRRTYTRNNLQIGTCGTDDPLVYVDNTIVENSGPGVLNGTIEVYVDAPVEITCVKVQNQMDEEMAATPALNSGGLGKNWVFIDVACKYNQGFHFLIEIYGKYTSKQTVDNHL